MFYLNEENDYIPHSSHAIHFVSRYVQCSQIPKYHKQMQPSDVDKKTIKIDLKELIYCLYSSSDRKFQTKSLQNREKLSAINYVNNSKSIKEMTHLYS